jgi:predicted ATPase with chaperone activity
MKILKTLETTTNNVDTFERLQGVTNLIESVRQFHHSCMSGIMSSRTSLLCQKLIVENYVATLKDDNTQFLEANVDEFRAWVLDRATKIERVTDSIADTSDATSFDVLLLRRLIRLQSVNCSH